MAEKLGGDHSVPWYETNLIWAPITLGIGAIFTVVAAMKHDLRWMLIFAWLCFVIATWVVARRFRAVWWITAGSILVMSAGLFWMNWWLRPAIQAGGTAATPTPEANTPQQQPEIKDGTPKVIPIPNTPPPKRSPPVVTEPLPKAQSNTPVQPPSINQNCPGGICAGGDINFAPPLPPPPTIKVCTSDSTLQDSIYSTVITFATNVQVFQPGFLMSFDKPVDYGGVRIGFHPLGMNAGIRLDTIPHPENSVGFRILSIDMSRSSWEPEDGSITATVTSQSPVKLLKVEGGRGEGSIVHFDKIVLQCDK